MVIIRGSVENNNSVSMHHKNQQALAIEMFQVHAKTSPGIIHAVFLVKGQKNYNFWYQTGFVIPQVKNTNYGLESIQVLAPKYKKSFPII